MKHLILYCTFLFVTACSVQANSNNFEENNFPSCEEVLSHVVKNLRELPIEGQSLSLAKKPEGYFLAVLNYEDRELKNMEYFPLWDSEKEEFIQPRLVGIRTKSVTKDQVEDHFSNVWNMNASYDFMMYHGYPKSSIDIIEALEGKDGLGLTQYEQLARAYSNQATRYIHPMVAGMPPEFAKNFEHSNYEKISQKRLDESQKYMNKSMAYWEKIQEKDPNYLPHIIKNLQLKIANERMHFWMQYLSIREPDLAQKALDKVKYAKVDLDVAKRILDNCEKNAFLFTNGDNDSFPLWYVQEKYGYRSDVVILNTSLMQTDWYLSMCKARHNYKTHLTSQDYENYQALVVVPYEEGETSINAIIMDSLSKLGGTVPKEGYILVPRSITVDLGQESKPTLNGGSYLFLWEIALFDMMISNPERAYGSIWPGMTWRQIGLRDYDVSRATISQFSMKGEDGSSENETTALFLDEHLKKINLDQIDRSILTRFEFSLLLGNLIRLKTLSPTDYERIGAKLANELNIERVASITDRPSVVTSAAEVLDDLKPMAGKQLREKFAKQAVELIGSLNDDGTNLLEKKLEISTIFQLYTGKPIYSNRYTLDKYDESAKDKEVLEVLLKKLKTIDANISAHKMIKTITTLDNYLQQVEEVLE